MKFLSDILAKAGLTVDGVVTFNNTATGQTPATNDNSTKLATTAFIKNQSYLTANQTITVSGDATGSGTASIILTLANSGVTAGVYGNASNIPTITVDAKGRITSISTNAVSIVTTLAGLSDVTLTSPSANQVLQYNGTQWVNGAAPTTYTLPIATSSVLGGIKVGTGLSIDPTTGVLTASGGSGGAASIKSTQTFTATAAQTVFTITGGYIVGLIDVFLNGVYLSPNQTTATNGTSITLGDAALAGDIIDVIIASPVFQGATTTTDQLSEGTTNLYFTNARARAAISLTTTGTSGAASYNSTTGVLNIPNYAPDLSGYVTLTTSQSISGVKTFNPSVTASGAIARGTNLTPTLTAAANSDVLVGLDINPTFTNGAFTGVSNIGIRYNSSSAITPFFFQSTSSGTAYTTNIIGGNNDFNISSRDILTARFRVQNGTNGVIIYSYNNVSNITNEGTNNRIVLYNSNYFYSTGNVGINQSTDAGFKLDVNGTARVQGSLTTTGNITIANATYYQSLTSTGTTVRMLGINSGNVAYVGAIDAGAVSTIFNASSTSLTASFYTSGTEKLTINSVGSLGIGTTTLGGINLAVGKNITGGYLTTSTAGAGIVSNGQIQSDVTLIAFGYATQLSTQATAFTLGGLQHYTARNVSIGSTSAIGIQTGFNAENLTGAGTNYGFRGNITAATNSWNLYMEGTANNYMAGSLGIGSTSLTNSSLNVSKTITGSTTSIGIVQGGVVQSGVTSNAYGFYNSATTQAAAFTLGTYIHYGADQSTIGSGSAITTQVGYNASATLIGATNNYGFKGSIASGTNRWNLYMDGTANNYMAGSLGIGTTSLTGYNLHISKNLQGAATSYGIMQDGLILSDVTTIAYFNRTLAQTQATTFTLANLTHYFASQATFGAGSTVSNQTGFHAAGTLAGAGANYGFRGQIASAANNWNLYMDGTANNYLGGNLGIGSASIDTTMLRISRSFTSTITASIFLDSQVSSTNASANYIVTSANTEAATFTTNIRHISLQQGTFGAGSTVTDQFGIIIGNLTGATNNYGFFGNISAATNRWNLYMGGTANNYMAGSLGIGNSSLTGINFRVFKNVTGGTTSYNAIIQGAVQSDVTTAAFGVTSELSTQAASFTLPTFRYFYASQSTIGAGSTVTNQAGFWANSNLIGATNNYGFYGEIPSGTNRWNLYMAGTAANYMAGVLNIGTTTLSGYTLDVNGTGRFSGNLRVDGTSNGYLTLNATSTGGNESGIFFQVGGGNKWENYTANNDTALNWYSYANSTIVFKLASTGAATFSSSVTATSLIKSGGTSSQFLMADGSVNTSVLPSGAYLPLAGGTVTGLAQLNNIGFTSIVSLFGQRKIELNEISDVLYRADNRFTLTGGLGGGPFDGSFDSGQELPINTTTVWNINIANQSGVPVNGITYPEGNLYISFYYTNNSYTSVTVRVKANGVFYTLSAPTDISTSASFKVLKFIIGSNNYLTDIEITWVTGASLVKVAAINLMPGRWTHEWELPYVSKYLSTNILPGNLLLGINTFAGYKLDVNGTARVVSTLTVGSTGNTGTINLARTSNGGIMGAIIQTNDVTQFYNYQGSGIDFYVAAGTTVQRAFIRTTGLGVSGTTGGSFTIDASAALQINATTQGFLPPRMTAAQRTAIASPATGLIVYQTDGVEGIWVNTSTGWRELTVV